MEVRLSTHLKKTLRYYYTAKQEVLSSGYEYEIFWQDIVDVEKITVRSFYSEYAWVVLSSGMRESVIKNKFTNLTDVFENWENPGLISANQSKYTRKGLTVFNHEKKIQAIIWMAKHLSNVYLKDEIILIKEQGVEHLCKYPFLGPATSLHFAKNIGFHVSKPDRHLLRISDFLGYPSPEILCKKISSVIGEKESIVDLILWRYATLNKKYLT
jgi:hypothetical protein